MTVICGLLASVVCRSGRSRGGGGGGGGGGRRNNDNSDNNDNKQKTVLKKDRRREWRANHTCVRTDSGRRWGWGLGVGGVGGQQAARMEAGLILLRCHCASQRPSPLLSGYRNDAELCLLPTSWTGLIAGWVVVVGRGGSQCRLCLVLLAKRRPSATAESNGRGPSGLSGLGH